MIDLLLFPFGGNAREALIAALAQNNVKPTWNILGFIDDNEALWGKQSCGISVLGGRSKVKEIPSALILAVPGRPDNFRKRDRIIEILGLSIDRFAIVIDPSVRIAPDVTIGRNTVLMANVVVSASAQIGQHCVVLPNTVIAHDSVIEDYAVIGSNVTISGSCKIGRSCYIGSGSRVKDHRSIGAGSLIGIGSNVIEDVTENVVVVGNPACFLRNLR